MIPAAFEYERPSSLDEALRSLAAGNGDAKVVAGGQSLLPLLKLRLASVGRLIDIGRIGELRGVRTLPDGGFAIGALTTYAELLESPVIGIAVMADVLPTIADLQVRNRGTIGGAVAHADPASDMPAVLLALQGTVVARSAKGERSIPMQEFVVDSFQSSLEHDEIVTEIRLPSPSELAGSAYLSLEQSASGYALVGVAVTLGPLLEGRIDDLCVALTGVGPVPYRATAVESAMRAGASPADAAGRATEGVRVNADIHADAAYRTAMAAIYTRRAIETALQRAG
jgi:aerobic carbon-monoxide dehydrogenase medium subunit